MEDEDHVSARMPKLIMSEDIKALERFIASYKGTIQLGPWLTFAAREGKCGSVLVLIQLGADVNYMNENGETPFSFACARNHLQAAKLLHKHGANVNEVVCGESTPLDIAVCWASPDFRSWLMSIGGIRKQDFAEWPWPPRI